MKNTILIIGLFFSQLSIFGQDDFEELAIKNLLTHGMYSRNDTDWTRRIWISDVQSEYFGKLTICTVSRLQWNLLPRYARFVMKQQKMIIMEVNTSKYKEDIDYVLLNELIEHRDDVGDLRSDISFLEEFERLTQNNLLANDLNEILASINPTFSGKTKEKLRKDYQNLNLQPKIRFENHGVVITYFSMNKTLKYLLYENTIKLDMNGKIMKYYFYPCFDKSDVMFPIL